MAGHASLLQGVTTSLLPPPGTSVLESVLSFLAEPVEGGKVPRRWPGRGRPSPAPAGLGGQALVEQALVEQARRGDGQALGRLCCNEWTGVLRMVRASVADPEEAEEVTQEVFARAIASLPRFVVTGAPFRAYLGQIARNLLRDRWRHEQACPTLERLGHDAADRPSPEPPPEAVVLAADQRQVLLNAIQHLPPRYREVLRLRVIEGRSAAEIGAAWGRSPEAVRQIQHRAVLALRGEMAAGGWGAQ